MDEKNEVKNRVTSIRLRALVLTAGIIIGLILYIFVNLITKQAMSWIDFSLLVILQYLVYGTYFPEGEEYGKKDQKYQTNYKAYNFKAGNINKTQRINKLREFCKLDYERRVRSYIATECGALGITIEELEQLRKLSIKEIKVLKQFSFKYPKKTVDGKEEIGEKLVIFSRHKRKRIYNLLFKPLPVKEVQAETIMSAVENNGQTTPGAKAKKFRTKQFIMKAVQVILTAVLLAYVGYQARGKIGLEEIFRMFMYLFTIVANAVTAYTTGESCTKVYRSGDYVDLCNFIDEFNEWSHYNPEEIEEIKEEA